MCCFSAANCPIFVTPWKILWGSQSQTPSGWSRWTFHLSPETGSTVWTSCWRSLHRYELSQNFDSGLTVYNEHIEGVNYIVAFYAAFSTSLCIVATQFSQNVKSVDSNSQISLVSLSTSFNKTRMGAKPRGKQFPFSCISGVGTNMEHMPCLNMHRPVDA